MAFTLAPTLSPSRLDRFTHCALAFRFSYIDRLPDPSTVDQLRGTLVHRALQLLHAVEPAAERTPGAARACLATAWAELAGEVDAIAPELAGGARQSLLRSAEVLLDRYFTLEDPRQVHPLGLELGLRARLGDVELYGIIDRLDLLPNGGLAVVDYKTGRSPQAERSRARLAGVHFYAYLCEQMLGRRPAEVRLMYLRDQVVVVEQPTEQSMRGLRQRTLAAWTAIERACSEEDFRPCPSSLCRYCAYRSDYCPAFGGTPPGLPAAAIEPAALVG